MRSIVFFDEFILISNHQERINTVATIIITLLNSEFFEPPRYLVLTD